MSELYPFIPRRQPDSAEHGGWPTMPARDSISCMPRPPAIHHCTSLPAHFFGRQAELALLDRALGGAEPSVAALIGPGGQGKTAIVQHWLQSAIRNLQSAIFFWSFYR